MCNNCYHSSGRNKKAWKCTHADRPHYALGLCQTCYQLKYTTKARNNLQENSNFIGNAEEDAGEVKNLESNLKDYESPNLIVNFHSDEKNLNLNLNEDSTEKMPYFPAATLKHEDNTTQSLSAIKIDAVEANQSKNVKINKC